MSGQNSTHNALPPINGEVIPTGEAEATRAVLQVVEAKVRDTARSNPPARRDAHPKGHGCVSAEFRILDNLPPELRLGLFATPGRYDAWIRYSNGNPTPREDRKGDGRGMAIKLMGVADSPSTTQDFILINHPVFAARNVVDYLALEQAKSIWRFFLPGFNPLNFRAHEALITLAILRKKVSSLLNIQYWSMSAYRFGDSACKFSARPAGPNSPFTATDDPNFLRANLVRRTAEPRRSNSVKSDGRRTRPDSMPVEDATIEWSETDAPFVPVARITIPKQTFDSPEQMNFLRGHVIPQPMALRGRASASWRPEPAAAFGV